MDIEAGQAVSNHGDGIDSKQYSVFYKFYQIDSHPKTHEAEGRSGRGLKTLWGSLWSVCTSTGWTLEQILWKISWVNLQMMIVDAPRYSSDEEETDRIIPEPETIEEIDQLMKRFKQ